MVCPPCWVTIDSRGDDLRYHMAYRSQCAAVTLLALRQSHPGLGTGVSSAGSGGSNAMLADIVRRMRARVQPGYRIPHYDDPHAYWERRHREAGATLDGVGLWGLGSAGNLADYERKWEHIRAVLERLDPHQGGHLLDAGCGIGWFSARAAALGFEVQGVDFSSAAVDTARRLSEPDVGFHVAALHTFAPGRRYDVVMCIDVLFHIVDDQLWRETVRNLASLVAGSGHLIIQEQLATAHSPAGDTSRTHVRRRAEADYRDLLSGWRLVERDTYTLPAQGSRKDLLRFSRDLGS
jgi:SAM-dependent methyltransferase